MNFPQNTHDTLIDLKMSLFDVQEVDGILYFTVDFGIRGKQRWKTDGTK